VSSGSFPETPRSYREEEVHFLSGGDSLAGVLCLPQEPGLYPAVVYIPGSGRAARDGLGMLPQHWEAFARRGIASFLKPAGQKVFAPGYLDLIAEWVQQRFGREQE
jgi:hypothetical protein